MRLALWELKAGRDLHDSFRVSQEYSYGIQVDSLRILFGV